MDDESYTTATGDLLSFSVDTLSLDTVITSLGTPTKSFMIYNHNEKTIRISYASLQNGNESGFRINIDGIYISDKYQGQLEVRGKDSIRVFVEQTAKEQNNDEALLITDKLSLTLESGIQQSVVLQSYGQDVIPLRNLKITSDTTLASKRPYHVFDTLTIAEGATLHIAPGVRFLFHSGAGIKAYGTIKAEGTLEKPIIFRGDRLDNIFENQPYDRLPGRWNGIRLMGNSYYNVFNNCDIHSTYTAIQCDSSALDKEKLRLENSIIMNAKGKGVSICNSRAFVGNTQITNTQSYCVYLCGGYSEFVHCTIGSFYGFDSKRESALFFTNGINGVIYPLEKAAFLNSIITGYSEDEIYGVGLSEQEDSEIMFNYYFSHCLLRTPAVLDKPDHYFEIIWDKKENKVSGKDNFKNFDFDKLLFDFRLDSLSPAIGIGDTEITRTFYPFDRNGVARLQQGASDAGCYEYVLPEQKAVRKNP